MFYLKFRALTHFVAVYVCLLLVGTGISSCSASQHATQGHARESRFFGGSVPVENHTIANPLITNWGTWGEWHQCPSGTFAYAYQLKVAPYDPNPTSDNTALDGIKLYCGIPPSNGGDSSRTSGLNIAGEVTSSVGSLGQWGPIVNCSGEPLIGFALEVVAYKGTSFRKLWKSDTDDVGAIAFNGYARQTLICTNPELQEYHDPAGQWTPAQFCEKGYKVCGIKTQVDEYASDKTGLNNVELKCCDH